MEKEAVEKHIADVLLNEGAMRSEVAADMVAFKIRQRLEAHSLLRKVTEPPLLSDEAIQRISHSRVMGRYKEVAEAQRQADIKHNEG